jgi:hypothetical protein
MMEIEAEIELTSTDMVGADPAVVPGACFRSGHAGCMRRATRSEVTITQSFPDTVADEKSTLSPSVSCVC